MSFNSAAFIQERMKQSEVYATVTEGKYKGSVGKIVEVKRVHFDRHDYVLEIDGKKHKFSGAILKQSSSHEVELVCDNDYQKEFLDFNGRVIEVGKLIVVTKSSSKNSQNEMLLGNVRRIDSTGIFVEPFAVNGAFFAGGTNYVRVTKTTCAMVIDTTTHHSVLLNKLASLDPTG